MIGTRARLASSLFRWVNQIAISVLATVIATSLYSAWRPPVSPAATSQIMAPLMTAAGKFATRIEGAETAEAASPRPPILSIVNPGLTPTRTSGLIDEIARQPAYGELAASVSAAAVEASPAQKIVRAASHEPKRAAAAAEVAVAKRVANLPQLDLHTIPLVDVAAEEPHGLWSMARSAVGLATSIRGSLLTRFIP